MRKIVVKIGSSVIAPSGKLDLEIMRNILAQVVAPDGVLLSNPKKVS